MPAFLDPSTWQKYGYSRVKGFTIASGITTAQTGEGFVNGIDLGDPQAISHKGEFAFEVDMNVISVNPGAGLTFKLYYAFSTQNELELAQFLSDNESKEITLQNSQTRQIMTVGPFLARARYLYLWYDHGIKANGAIVNGDIRLVGVA
jgi:hypothetical protein